MELVSMDRLIMMLPAMSQSAQKHTALVQAGHVMLPDS